ncbi:hypothetical protein HU200_013491 [Digitaria exilis]|uniref:K Homology domain-containing protein n=1 Tax=Digitaria exilis TaxID=1010633 RepID=A0A835KJL1_9POAL|nr:hypothetical protein HU200_013491 [Digitaria exilis]
MDAARKRAAPEGANGAGGPQARERWTTQWDLQWDQGLMVTLCPPPMPVPDMVPPSTFGASATAKISVDASLAGGIIGKGGTNTKHISRVTGAKLAIRDNEADPNLKNIELEGTFDQIKHASAMVTELIVRISGKAPPQAKNNPGRGSHAGDLEATSRPSCVRISIKVPARLGTGATLLMAKVSCANLLLLDRCAYCSCGGYSAYIWLNNTRSEDNCPF